MPVKLILFDVDGTLVDTAGAGRRAMVRAFHEVFGIDGVDALARSIPFAGMTDSSIFTALAEVAGVDGERFRSDRERLRAGYVEALRGEMARPDERWRTMPGIPRLLEELARNDDARLGLLTGNLEEGARIKLEPFGLNRYFPGGGFGSDHADRREVARVARERLARIHEIAFDAADVVVVGDTAADVDCARANGFRAVAVACGWGSRRSLEAAAPEQLLDDLGDTGTALAALGLE